MSVTCVILPQNTSCRSPKVLTLAKGLSPYSRTYLRLGGTAADFCTFTLSNNTSRNAKMLHPGRLSEDDLLFHLKRNKHKNLTEFFMTGNSYFNPRLFLLKLLVIQPQCSLCTCGAQYM